MDERLPRLYYARQRALSRRVEQRLAALWRQVDADDLDGSWAAAEAMRVIVAGQTASVIAADPYVAATVRAQDGRPDRAGRLNPTAFVGTAADGRGLGTLIREPVIAVKQQLLVGQPVESAMRSGLASLTRIGVTEVADAGRTATGVAMNADRAVTGWVRMLSPPSCGRCAVLAGRHYRTNAGFDRHPGCDCQAIPSVENRADDLRTDPRLAVEKGQITDLSRADRRAILDGADVGQVINARRGMYQAGGRKLTREGTTARGHAGKRQGNLEKVPGERLRRSTTMRPRPEAIYADTATREEAVEMLRRFGYIA